MNNKPYFPIQIIFRTIAPSVAIEETVYKHALKLERYFDQIKNCHLMIETHHHQHKGKIYHVVIELKVPNTVLVANRDPSENHAHEDVYVALRDAFNAVKNQLKEYTQKLHGHVKHHEQTHENKIDDQNIGL